MMALGFLAVMVLAAEHVASPQFTEDVTVTALSVPIRLQGLPARLVPGREKDVLEVRLAGFPAQILSLEPLFGTGAQSSPASSVVEMAGARPGRLRPRSFAGDSRKGVLVVLVNGLCDPRNKTHLLKRLELEPARVTSLAPVGMAIAGDGERWVGGAHTVAEYQRLVQELAKVQTVNWQLKLRREARFGLLGPNAFALAKVTSGEEQLRIRLVLESLRRTLVRSASGRRAAILLWDGFDVETSDYYQGDLALLAKQERESRQVPLSADRLTRRELLVELTGLKDDISSLGIPVVSLNPGYMAAYAPVWTAEFRRPAVSPEAFIRRGSVAADELLTVAAHEPLEYLAEETGGVVIPPRESLAEGLKRLEDTYLLWFQLPMVPDGKTHALEVRAKEPGVRVWAPKAITVGSSGGQAVVRAREIGARGYLAEGELAPQLVLKLGKVEGGRRIGRLELRTDLGAVRAALERLRRARLRVTVAVHMRKGEPFVHQEEFQQAVDEGSEGTVWTYEAPISLPKEAERLAVVVEELQTGAWGAAVLDLKGEGKP